MLPYRKITNDFPSRDSANIKAKELNAEVITAARQLDIYSNVYPTGDVTFIAGEKIRFMPGFHAYRNCHVHSYIDNSLNHEIYYNETNTDPCNGQGSVCDKRSSPVKGLKLTDGNENKIESATNANNFNNRQDDFILIYPNPATDYIKIESHEMIGKIAIQSMDGKVFINKTINAKTSELNIKALPPGVFLIKIQNARKVHFKRIIKR